MIRVSALPVELTHSLNKIFLALFFIIPFIEVIVCRSYILKIDL